MSTSNNRSLIFVILFLLLTNIGVLGYFLWYNKPAKPNNSQQPRSGISMALQNDVGFDSLQIKEYKKLREQQWAIIKPMFEDMRKAKDSFFRLVSNDAASDSMINAAADMIAQKQRAIDMQAFTHFREVRALCQPDQFVKYDSLVQRIVRKMNKSPRGNDQNKKDKK